MAPTMYGAISHCTMLIVTTRMPNVKRSNTPAKLRMTVNTKVDNPIIRAKVPAIERRSFHRLIILFTLFLWINGNLYLLCATNKKTVLFGQMAHSRMRKLNGNELSGLRRLVRSGCNCLELLGFTLDLDSGEIHDQLRNDALCSKNDVEILQVLLAHYAASKPAERTGKLGKFRDLPGGYAYEEAFVKRVIQPVATVFGDKPEGLVEAAKLLKGVFLNYGDASVEIPVLEIRIVYILWGTGEFPASATALFDDSASHYLPTEDIAVLSELATIRLEQSWDILRKRSV